jgi:hypothetical protein
MPYVWEWCNAMFKQAVLAVEPGFSLMPESSIWAMEELASAALVSGYCSASRKTSNLAGKQYSSSETMLYYQAPLTSCRYISLSSILLD